MINIINSPGAQVLVIDLNDIKNLGEKNISKTKMYYVSHPFTGNEEDNRQEARKITAELKKKFEDDIFLNPLDAFKYIELVKDWDYNEALKQTTELLRKCDGIIMTGNWRNSWGCLKEKEIAENLQIEVIFFIDHPLPLTKCQDLLTECDALILMGD